MAPQKIYPPGVPNQEFAPLEVKNEKMGTVGKLRSLSGQVLFTQTQNSAEPKILRESQIYESEKFQILAGNLNSKCKMQMQKANEIGSALNPSLLRPC